METPGGAPPKAPGADRPAPAREVDYDHSVIPIRACRPVFVGALAATLTASSPAAGSEAGEAVEPTEAPVVELVPPEDPAIGEATVMALACDQDIREVGFWVDGRFVAADDSPPFELTTDFGATFEPHTVRALAVDRHQVVVGEASLQLNAGQPGLVAELRHDDREVRLRASAPRGSPPPVSFQIYAGGDQLVAQDQPRLDFSIPREDLRDVEVLQLAAEYDDGSRLDRFLLLNEGFNETVNVNEALLRVMVTDRRGRPVFDLDPDAFSVGGPDIRPKLTQVQRQTPAPLTLAVILDGSSSMDAYRTTLRRSTETLAGELLGQDDRLLLFDVADRPRLLNPEGDPSRAVKMLDELVPGGGSALYDSLYFAVNRLARTDGRKALVLVSDGADLDSYLETERVADVAWRAGVPVFLIASGTPSDGLSRLRAYKLRRFVDNTGGRAFYAGSARDQVEAFETILDLVREPYMLSVTASEGWRDLTRLREISVELRDPKLEARVSLGSDG